MHNGFINVDNEKMSKSLGNFFTIRDVLKEYDAETVRFFVVRSHYRSPLNYSDVHLNDARGALKRLYTALSLVAPAEVAIDWSHPAAARFKAAMDEDFGTPEAVAVLFELAAEVNRSKSAETAGLLKALAGCLGLLQGDPQAFLQAGAADVDAAAIEAQIAARAAAKAAGTAEADRIRKARWSRASCLATPRRHDLGGSRQGLIRMPCQMCRARCGRCFDGLRQTPGHHGFRAVAAGGRSARARTATGPAAGGDAGRARRLAACRRSGRCRHAQGQVLPAPPEGAPAYWAEACRQLVRRDRVMKRLIPRFAHLALQPGGDAAGRAPSWASRSR